MDESEIIRIAVELWDQAIQVYEHSKDISLDLLQAVLDFVRGLLATSVTVQLEDAARAGDLFVATVKRA